MYASSLAPKFDFTINPLSVGLDNEKKVYSCVGDPDQRITFTSKEDIGRALAELSILSMPRSTVPDFVRLRVYSKSQRDQGCR